MEEFSYVNRILADNAPIDEWKIINQAIPVENLSLSKIRDVLLKIGKIQREYLAEQCYVAIIPGGFFKKNYAVVSIELRDNILFLAAYADEGIIKQHTCEGVINELRRNIQQFIRR